jgi:hypothetical protein
MVQLLPFARCSDGAPRGGERIRMTANVRLGRLFVCGTTATLLAVALAAATAGSAHAIPPVLPNLPGSLPILQCFEPPPTNPYPVLTGVTVNGDPEVRTISYSFDENIAQVVDPTFFGATAGIGQIALAESAEVTSPGNIVIARFSVGIGFSLTNADAAFVSAFGVDSVSGYANPDSGISINSGETANPLLVSVARPKGLFSLADEFIFTFDRAVTPSTPSDYRLWFGTSNGISQGDSFVSGASAQNSSATSIVVSFPDLTSGDTGQVVWGSVASAFDATETGLAVTSTAAKDRTPGFFFPSLVDGVGVAPPPLVRCVALALDL